MSAHPLAFCATVLLIGFSAPLPAQESESVVAEMRRLQTLLTVINSELKSDLDQVQMLQEALKANARPWQEGQARSPDVVSVQDGDAVRRQAFQRETAIYVRLEAILARSATLAATKQPIVERVLELGRLPVAATATPVK